MIALILVLLVALIAVPLAAIWAINTLFTLTIAYTVWNWLAMLVLVLIFSGASSSKD